MRTGLIHTIFYLFLVTLCYGKEVNRIIISADMPVVEHSDISQQINYQIPFTAKANVHIRCFQLRATGSLKVYDLVFNDVPFKKGIHKNIFNFHQNSELVRVNDNFLDVLKKFELLPAGKYITYLDIVFPDSNFSVNNEYYWAVDSSLEQFSDLRKEIDNALLGKKGKIKVSKRSTQPLLANNKVAPATALDLKRSAIRVNKKVGKVNGVISVPEVKDDKSFTALYYKDFFLGRYEVVQQKSTRLKIAAEREILNHNPASLIKNNLEDFTSVTAQIKKIYSKGSAEKEIQGTIDIATAFSNGQEANSAQDNNYGELRGSLSHEVLNIPVTLEGFYTTQDVNRKARASYIRVQYDAESAKNELAKMISTYKRKYSDSKLHGGGLAALYNDAIGGLKHEKSTLLNALTREYGIEQQLLENYSGDVDKILPALDTASIVTTALDEVETDSNKRKKIEKIKRNKQEIKKRYEQVNDIVQKIEKYDKLVKQYQNQLYFDSAITYTQLQQLAQQNDVSYKQMLKSAEGLLPAGTVSKLSSGLSYLNLGIINEYQSNYTVAGQNLKGGSIGYDFGVVQTDVVAGKTEYVSRDGNVDKYNTLMTRLNYKQGENHKIGLIYYTCSPSNQVTIDADFFKSDIAIPSFRTPVQVLSLLYEGSVKQNLVIHTESATSFKGIKEIDAIGKDNTAIKATVDYIVPVAPVSVKAEWEHIGNLFENNALPFPKAATDRYTFAANAALFRSKINVGLQYNFLRQETFSTTGYNTKWGFDIKTHFKQHPNFSISYKPFSTFRTFDDTLAIQQRPMIGEVWTGGGRYQLKKGNVVQRFMLTYNQNSSQLDTVHYETRMLQGGYVFTNKLGMIAANAGWMKMPAMDSSHIITGSSYFVNLTVMQKINDRVYGSLGQEIGFAGMDILKTGTTAGATYSFKKIPLSIRLMLRYVDFKQPGFVEQSEIWAGQVGINWQFKKAYETKRK